MLSLPRWLIETRLTINTKKTNETEKTITTNNGINEITKYID